MRRADGVAAEFRVIDGGHDWDVWRPAFVDGLKHLAGTLSATPPAGLPGPLHGTAGQDWAGGVAAHPDGATTIGYAASGGVAGQPYAGGLDAVVSRIGGWTAQFGTPANDRLYGVAALADGGVLAAGYTRGDLDGTHPGSPADDAFLTRLTASGQRSWLTQVGDAAKADRFYALAAAPDGGAYVAGYTSGSFAGQPTAGDKDAVLARVAPDGRVVWSRQLGGPGEDKAYAVAADANGVYVAGSTSAGMPGTTPLGGLDGWLAHYGTNGEPGWVTAVGGADDDLLGGVAINTNGLAVATGSANGDVLTAAYSTAGKQRWQVVTGGPGADAGADVVPLPGGDVAVVGFTGSALGLPVGGADVLTLRLDARGRQQGVAQYGTARDDAADPFGEENVYATRTADGRLLVSGFTAGSPIGGGAPGNGDVFLTTVDPLKGTP